MTEDIRVARAEEHDEIASVVVAAYAPFDISAAYHETLGRTTAARAREAELLVATGPRGILGTVTYVPDGGPWGEIAGSDEAEFRMLAVAPAAQGEGVGAALVGHCAADARARGRVRLVCSSAHGMAGAHRLYERLGFERMPDRDWSPRPGMELVTFALALDESLSGPSVVQ